MQLEYTVLSVLTRNDIALPPEKKQARSHDAANVTAKSIALPFEPMLKYDHSGNTGVQDDHQPREALHGLETTLRDFVEENCPQNLRGTGGATPTAAGGGAAGNYSANRPTTPRNHQQHSGSNIAASKKQFTQPPMLFSKSPREYAGEVTYVSPSSRGAGGGASCRPATTADGMRTPRGGRAGGAFQQSPFANSNSPSIAKLIQAYHAPTIKTKSDATKFFSSAQSLFKHLPPMGTKFDYSTFVRAISQCYYMLREDEVKTLWMSVATEGQPEVSLADFPNAKFLQRRLSLVFILFFLEKWGGCFQLVFLFAFFLSEVKFRKTIPKTQQCSEKAELPPAIKPVHPGGTATVQRNRHAPNVGIVPAWSVTECGPCLWSSYGCNGEQLFGWHARRW